MSELADTPPDSGAYAEAENQYRRIAIGGLLIIIAICIGGFIFVGWVLSFGGIGTGILLNIFCIALALFVGLVLFYLAYPIDGVFNTNAWGDISFPLIVFVVVFLDFRYKLHLPFTTDQKMSVTFFATVATVIPACLLAWLFAANREGIQRVPEGRETSPWVRRFEAGLLVGNFVVGGVSEVLAIAYLAGMTTKAPEAAELCDASLIALALGLAWRIVRMSVGSEQMRKVAKGLGPT